MAAIIYLIRERPSEYVPLNAFDSTISSEAGPNEKRLRFLEALDPSRFGCNPCLFSINGCLPVPFGWETIIRVYSARFNP